MFDLNPDPPSLGQAGQGSPDAFRADLQIARRIYRDGLPELVARMAIIGAAVVTGLLAYGLLVPLAWYVSYFGLVLAHRRLVDAANGGRRPNAFPVLVTLSVVMATLYTSFVLYLWLSELALLQLAGLLLLIGAVIHTAILAERMRVLGLVDAVGVVVMLIVIGVTFLPPDMPMLANLIASGMTCGLGLYYAFAIHSRRRERALLRATEYVDLDSRKAEIVGRLTGGLAHDFNNLLTVVLGNLDLADMAESRDARRAALAQARWAAQRGAGLIAQLMSFARQAPMTARPVAVAPFLDDFRAITRAIVPPEVEVRIEVAEGTPDMLVDPGHLTGALVALLTNAREAMPGGGVALFEASGPVPDIGGRPLVRLDVYDEGRGIRRSDLPFVTDPYFTTKRPGQGPGLGLSMVKGFAEQSGGRLLIDSVPGAGTQVTLFLPAAPGPARGGS